MVPAIYICLLCKVREHLMVSLFMSGHRQEGCSSFCHIAYFYCNKLFTWHSCRKNYEWCIV